MKHRTSVKHKPNKMQVLISSKAKLGQPLGLMASPRGGERHHPRKVVESQKSNPVVVGMRR